MYVRHALTLPKPPRPRTRKGLKSSSFGLRGSTQCFPGNRFVARGSSLVGLDLHEPEIRAVAATLLEPHHPGLLEEREDQGLGLGREVGALGLDERVQVLERERVRLLALRRWRTHVLPVPTEAHSPSSRDSEASTHVSSSAGGALSRRSESAPNGKPFGCFWVLPERNFSSSAFFRIS